VLEDYQERLKTVEEKMVDGERREEELKNELDILSTTI
jgi:hypothetical protein